MQHTLDKNIKHMHKHLPLCLKRLQTESRYSPLWSRHSFSNWKGSWMIHCLSMSFHVEYLICWFLWGFMFAITLYQRKHIHLRNYSLYQDFTQWWQPCIVSFKRIPYFVLCVVYLWLYMIIESRVAFQVGGIIINLSDPGLGWDPR